jgi:hypothetical protein
MLTRTKHYEKKKKSRKGQYIQKLKLEIFDRKKPETCVGRF